MSRVGIAHEPPHVSGGRCPPFKTSGPKGACLLRCSEQTIGPLRAEKPDLPAYAEILSQVAHLGGESPPSQAGRASGDRLPVRRCNLLRLRNLQTPPSRQRASVRPRRGKNRQVFRPSATPQFGGPRVTQGPGSKQFDAYCAHDYDDWIGCCNSSTAQCGIAHGWAARSPDGNSFPNLPSASARVGLCKHGGRVRRSNDFGVEFYQILFRAYLGH
jgi:hypothetical protein